MKISSAAVFAICIPSSVAFMGISNRKSNTGPSNSYLSLQKVNEDREISWVGPAMTTLAGLTLASQVAGASMAPVTIADVTTSIILEDSMQQINIARTETSPVTTITGTSLQIAAKDNSDFLDFSLPSYGDSVGSSAPSKFSLPSLDIAAPRTDNVEESSSSPAPTSEDNSNEKEKAAAAAAERKAEAAAAKEAEREEAAQRKAEEKADKEAEKEATKQAAAEKKAADAAEAAQKKVEKEARREAEKEKQRLVLERAKAEKTEAEVSKEKEAPDTATSFSVPDIKIPEFTAPDFSSFKAPDIKIPKIKTPDYDLDISDKARNVELPKVSLSNFSPPSFSSGSNTVDFDGESQEIRDERAKEARSEFNGADSTAKEYENKAKQLRDIANDKKRIAIAGKDEACKTRFGGKVLCIRPFGIGY